MATLRELIEQVKAYTRTDDPMIATIISNGKLHTLKITNTTWNRELEIGRPYDPINKAFICVNRPAAPAENSTSLAIGLTEKEAVQVGKHLCKLGGLDVDKLEADAGIAKLNVDRLRGQLAEAKGTQAGLRENIERLEQQLEQLKHNTADDKKNAAKWRYDSECLQGVHNWLDLQGIDKTNKLGESYNLTARIGLLVASEKRVCLREVQRKVERAMLANKEVEERLSLLLNEIKES